MKQFKCQYCNRKGKSLNSNRQHEIRCKLNPQRIEVKPSYGMLGKKGKNQYHYGAICSEETRKKLSESSRNIRWTEEQKQKHSERMKQVVIDNPEAYSSSNRGRTKQQIVDGIKCQGQWEVDFYLWCKRHQIACERCNEWFDYTWQGLRKYNPDFYLPNLDLYIEVKGYATERDHSKWRDFPKKLTIINKHSILSIRNNKFSPSSLVVKAFGS